MAGTSPAMTINQEPDAIVDRAVFHADSSYYLPDVTITGYGCKTNTVSNTAFRGFGGPQGMAATEYVVDEIARHLSRDPLEVRLANLYGRDDRNVTPYFQTIRDNIGIPRPRAISSPRAAAPNWRRRSAPCPPAKAGCWPAAPMWVCG